MTKKFNFSLHFSFSFFLYVFYLIFNGIFKTFFYNLNIISFVLIFPMIFVSSIKAVYDRRFYEKNTFKFIFLHHILLDIIPYTFTLVTLFYLEDTFLNKAIFFTSFVYAASFFASLLSNTAAMFLSKKYVLKENNSKKEDVRLIIINIVVCLILWFTSIKTIFLAGIFLITLYNNTKILQDYILLKKSENKKTSIQKILLSLYLIPGLIYILAVLFGSYTFSVSFSRFINPFLVIFGFSAVNSLIINNLIFMSMKKKNKQT